MLTPSNPTSPEPVAVSGRYPYRHTLDLDPDDPRFDDEGKAILRAAFTVAERAHAQISRGKIEPQWKYISHPLMAYDIMLKLGERDPITLAAMLLGGIAAQVALRSYVRK